MAAALSAAVNVPSTELRMSLLPLIARTVPVAPELLPVTMSPTSGTSLPFGCTTRVGGSSVPASYSVWIACSQNILLQLASRNRSDGCVIL
jgi:hypothetical protein